MTWATRGAVVGFIFSFLASVLFSTRIYVPWEKLSTPPVEAVEVIPGPVQVPVIKDPSGSILAYYPDKWIRVESLDDLPYWGSVTEEECDPSSEQFWLSPNSPGDIIECVSLSQPMFEANFSSVIALAADGSIWIRQIDRYASDGLVSLGIIVSGPVIGALLGLIAYAISTVAKKWAG